MPGDNCSVFGCGQCRRQHGVGIFRVPGQPTQKELSRAEKSPLVAKNLAKKAKWRKEFLSAILKTRIPDDDFRTQITKDRVFACERHFLPTEIKVHQGEKMSKHKLVPGSIPRYNMRGSNVDERIAVEASSRPQRSIVVEHEQPPNAPPHTFYQSFDDFSKRVKNLKSLKNWITREMNEGIIFTLPSDQLTLPQYKISVDKKLDFLLHVYDFPLPSDHTLHTQFSGSMKNITISNLITRVQNKKLCEGLKTVTFGTGIVLHSVPYKTDPFVTQSYQSKTFCRSKCCIVLLNDGNMCVKCSRMDVHVRYRQNEKTKRKAQPCKLKAPISATSVERVKLTLQSERLKCAQLERQLADMRSEISNSSLTVDNQLSGDFISILGKHKVTPFMNLFWQEQKKMFSRTSKGARFHPAIIRYCLSLHLKSPSAYEELRNSGILRLPSSRTLYDYKAAIPPKTGFNKAVLDDLKRTTKDYTDVQRHIGMVLDEMKIKSNLVFHKFSGELIGYLDLGDPDLNYSVLECEDELATYAMVFFIRGLAVALKYSLAYFATDGVSGHQIYPLFWEAVCLLEKVCNLRVMFTTADGASSNRSFFKMCAALDPTKLHDVPYRTKNLYNPGKYIYFFSDVPHLIKTSRNCLENSVPGEGKRYMWNDGNYILWRHITDLYYTDLQSGGKTCPRLTVDHIKLNPYSRMTVKFAAQVLSESVSKNLREWGTDASGTAEFCEHMDKFFDCLNSRSTTEATRKRKPFCEPFRRADDPRLDWLENVFLKYLDDWKASTQSRVGEFTQTDRNRMFISANTYTGIEMTIRSTLELVPYLLNNGFDFVLTERFCQDCLEEHFGDHRKCGGRSRNPDMYTFGHQTRHLRVQKQVTCTTGNTRGRYDHKRTHDSNVSDEKCPRRKKPKKESVV